MFPEARKFLVFYLGEANRSPERIVQQTATLKVLIMAVCLMYYYLQLEIDTEHLVHRIFELYLNDVKSEKLIRVKETVEKLASVKSRGRMYYWLFGLTEDFLMRAEELSEEIKSEDEAESVALKLYEEYFGV
jgi:hypothetical protein